MPADYIFGLYPILDTIYNLGKAIQSIIPPIYHKEMGENPTIEIRWVVYGIALLINYHW